MLLHNGRAGGIESTNAVSDHSPGATPLGAAQGDTAVPTRTAQTVPTPNLQHRPGPLPSLRPDPTLGAPAPSSTTAAPVTAPVSVSAPGSVAVVPAPETVTHTPALTPASVPRAPAPTLASSVPVTVSAAVTVSAPVTVPAPVTVSAPVTTSAPVTLSPSLAPSTSCLVLGREVVGHAWCFFGVRSSLHVGVGATGCSIG